MTPAPCGETACSSAPLPAGGGSELIWGRGLGRGQANLPSSRGLGWVRVHCGAGLGRSRGRLPC